MLWSWSQRTTQEKGKEKCVVLTTNTNKRTKRRNIWHGIIYTPPKIETYSKHLPRRNCCSLRLYCVFVHSLPPLTIVVVTHHTLPCAPWLLCLKKKTCVFLGVSIEIATRKTRYKRRKTKQSKYHTQ